MFEFDKYDPELAKLLIQLAPLCGRQYYENPPNGDVSDFPGFKVFAENNFEFKKAFKSPNSYATALQGSDNLREINWEGLEHESDQFNPFDLEDSGGVYIGFALTSPKCNIITLRGTITPKEWWNNFKFRQVRFKRFKPKAGKVHRGFKKLYKGFSTQVDDVWKSLDKSIPCLITGFSLGSALSTLAALSIVDDNDLDGEEADKVILYGIGGPRVGDEKFADYYNTKVRNAFRVVNFADVVPTLPPKHVNFGYGLSATYKDVGEEHSFLHSYGDVGENHAKVVKYDDDIPRLEPYYTALQTKNVVIDSERVFPNSGEKCNGS
ncbi:MAG: lipase family protein [Symploca sp. SIO2E9]|nr:lipase family protein [Symploca sp. SIO2E9]